MHYRYIIDITQLVHWSGNLTGIPRVMDELAIRFHEDKKADAIFVSWVRELGQMCEVNFEVTRQHRGNGINFVRNSTSINSTVQLATDAQSHSLHITKQLTKKVIKKVAAKSRLDRTPLYHKAKNTRRSLELKSYKIYKPQAGDKFFIPWGEWWDQNWLNLVKNYTSQSVQIYPVCHDILPMVVPQFSGNSSSLENFVKQIFPISTTVITQSASTKQDLTDWMQKNQLQIPSIKTFRLGEDFTIRKSKLDSSMLSSKYGIKKDDYIMYVSTIEPRKNHSILYYAYKLAYAKGIQLPKLLIVGRIGHDTTEIIKMIKEDPEINTNISIENNVDDSDLNWLYQNCKFAIMPSFYEGWGMSVIEGIARGKSAVIANTSSLLEMPDDCVIRFNPASTDECLAAIQEMSRPVILEKYRNAAKAYKRHTWDDAYSQVINILEEK